MFFAVKTEPAEPRGFRASCRDIPDIRIEAPDMDVLQSRIATAIPATLELHYRRNGKPIPAPSPAKRGETRIYVPARVQAKSLLWNLMLERGLDSKQLAALSGEKHSVIVHTLDLSKSIGSVEFIEKILGKLGQGLDVELLERP